jgi:hypothetical protein
MLSQTNERLWRLTAPGALLLAAVASGALAWWLVALPVFTLNNVEKHSTHFPLVFVHAIGGTLMLVLGATNLYIGTTRAYFRFHRLLGYIYLLGGTLGAITAISLALGNGHRKPLVAFTVDAANASDSGIALASLGGAWLIAAAMAYRAARNRRFDSHRQWMIRTYVLVWSFVLCRLIGRIPSLPELGGGAAITWLSWVGPLLMCEVVLQWSMGERRSSGTGVRGNERK